MAPRAPAMSDTLRAYYRAAPVPPIETAGDLSETEGYFRFGETVCYGRCAGVVPSKTVTDALPEPALRWNGERVELPFDIHEVVTNLQEERYASQEPATWLTRLGNARVVRSAYYLARPALPVNVRKHVQKLRFSGWSAIPFPAWPVDVTIQDLMQNLMAVSLRRSREKRLPFIWFWPDGAESCAVMTHDVEGSAGREFCARLVDLDESFGVQAAFQVVPESLTGAADPLVAALRSRGCEVNIHDFNHDGSLFHDYERFRERAAQINRYAAALGCRGFRSGSMYRQQSWYDAFEFSYDMSVPNVAHLEPQRGGCCTVMPYFVGRVLELPLTTTQDYSLFHILNDYSTSLWRRQIDIIRSRNGLITFITHPDYLIENRARAVYTDLLRDLAALRSDGTLWMAQPGEVDFWWRCRQQMSLVRRGSSWAIEGPGRERARLAYATLRNGRLVYEIDGALES